MFHGIQNGNCISLEIAPKRGCVAHANCVWQCKLLDHDEEDGGLGIDDLPYFKPTGDFSVYAQIGVSPPNAETRRRIRISLWSTTETKGAESLLGAAIDVDFEAEIAPGTPTFLRFRELAGPGEDEDDKRIAFPGAVLIVTIVSEHAVRLYWSFGVPVLAVHW